mmetsp:Transcript_152023/g.290989  ORF Transcript_152023/g.290989 Transcript_152023/m.290989 type:complete len:367 (+) Transcript_152023:49-1149(+)
MSAAVLPTADGNDNDLIRWGFQTLVDSYDAYHSKDADAQSSRPLREFAAEMPQALRPAARSAVQSEGPKPGGERKAGGSSGRARDDRSGRGGKKSAAEGVSLPRGKGPVKAALPGDPWAAAAAASRGPVPAPFASLDTQAQRTAQPAAADPPQPQADGQDVPEDPAVWKEYYRQMAEYFQQCESAIALQEAQSGSNSALPSSAQAAAFSGAATAPVVATAAAAAAPASSLPMPLSTPAAAAPMAAQTLHHMPGPGSYPGSAALMPAAAALSRAPLGADVFSSLGMPSPSPWPSAAASTSPAYSGLAGMLPGVAAPATAMPGLALPGASAGVSAGIGSAGDEGLMNLLMAWYLSGYYTGHYAARQGR